MKQSNVRRLTRMLCAALLLAVFIMQFLPFWHYGEENELACPINTYIWFPKDHEDLTGHFRALVGSDYRIEQILTVPIASMILSACGCILFLTRKNPTLTMAVSLICGLIGVYGYLSEPVFRLGSGWEIHLVLYGLLLILSAYNLFPDIKEAFLLRSRAARMKKRGA